MAKVTTGSVGGIFVASGSPSYIWLFVKRSMRLLGTSTNDVVGSRGGVIFAVAISAGSVRLGDTGRWWAGIVYATTGSMTIGACGSADGFRGFPAPDGQNRTRTLLRFAAKVYLQIQPSNYSTREPSTTYWLAGDSMRWLSDFTKRLLTCSRFRANQLHWRCSTNVAFCRRLSRLNQDPDSFPAILRQCALASLHSVGMAVDADLTLVGRDVVFCYLEPQWSESGRIFELFGPGIGIMLLYSTVGWIHLSIGKPGRWLRWTVVELAVTASPFLAALRWGTIGIAAAWSVSYWILLIPAFWYAGLTHRAGRVIFDGRCLAACRRIAVAPVLTAALFRGTPFSAAPSSAGAALEAVLIMSSTFVALFTWARSSCCIGAVHRCASSQAFSASSLRVGCLLAHLYSPTGSATVLVALRVGESSRKRPASWRRAHSPRATG